jgi:hypothetical protein
VADKQVPEQAENEERVEEQAEGSQEVTSTVFDPRVRVPPAESEFRQLKEMLARQHRALRRQREDNERRDNERRKRQAAEEGRFQELYNESQQELEALRTEVSERDRKATVGAVARRLNPIAHYCGATRRKRANRASKRREERERWASY